MGSSINQDGRTKAPMTSPSVIMQSELLKSACESASIQPCSISYVEAHGTGTPIGDPIEASALGQVIGEARKNAELPPLRIGSVKTNVGHLEPAAGIVSLIKTMLCLYNCKLVKSLHFTGDNPNIKFKDLHLKVQTEYEDWHKDKNQSELPLIAGVNSFGYGGANAHVIVSGVSHLTQKSLQSITYEQTDSRPLILMASSMTMSSLNDILNALCPILNQIDLSSENKFSEINDYCYTWARRTHHRIRAAVIGLSAKQMMDTIKNYTMQDNESKLEQQFNSRIVTGTRLSAKDLPVVLVFPGAGQIFDAVATLKRVFVLSESAQNIIQLADNWLLKQRKWSILQEIGLKPVETEENVNNNDTSYWSGACISLLIQVAMSAHLKSLNVPVKTVVGHSSGELSAAVVCGILSLEQALSILFAIADEVSSLYNTGGMLSVSTSINDVNGMIEKIGLKNCLDIAAINSPSNVTLSGGIEDLNSFSHHAKTLNVKPLINVKFPFHSHLLEKVFDKVLSSLQNVLSNNVNYTSNKSNYIFPDASIIISTASYSLTTGEQAINLMKTAGFWWHNARDTVNFADAFKFIVENIGISSAVIEVSPSPTLIPAIDDIIISIERDSDISSINNIQILCTGISNSELSVNYSLESTLAHLYVKGIELNSSILFPSANIRSFPCNPWQQQKYWSEAEHVYRDRMGMTLFNSKQTFNISDADNQLLGGLFKRQPIQKQNEWFYHSIFSLDRVPLIKDHVYANSTLTPATMFIEILWAVTNDIVKLKTGLSNQYSTFNNLQLKHAMWLESGIEYVTIIHVSTSANNDTIFHITISSCEKNSTEIDLSSINLIEHCRAEFDLSSKKNQSIASFQTMITSIASNNEFSINAQEIYNKLKETGFQFGDRFKLINELWIDTNTNSAAALVTLNKPFHLVEEMKTLDFAFHPGVIDAATQVINVTTSTMLSWVPIHFNSCTLYNPIYNSLISMDRIRSQQVWSYARLTKLTSEGHISGNVYMFDRTGRLLAEFIGFTQKNMGTAAIDPSSLSVNNSLDLKFPAITKDSISNSLEDLTYEYVLSDIKDNENNTCIIYEEDKLAGDSHTIILISNNDGQQFANILAQQINQLKSSINVYLQNLNTNIDIKNIIKEYINSNNNIISESQKTFACTFIAIMPEHNNNYASHMKDGLEEITELCLITAQCAIYCREFLQTQMTNNIADIRTLFVTHDASNSKSLSSAIQSCVSGFMRVASIEREDIQWTHVDLSANSIKKIELIPLLANISLHTWPANGNRFDEIRLQNLTETTIQVGRYVKSSLNSSIIDKSKIININSESSYLISGGCRGIGLKLAEWLVKQGARYLILLSRSGIPNDGIEPQIISKLHEANIQIEIVQCDVASYEQLQQTLIPVLNRIPTIRGIIHAASVFYDDFIDKLTLKRTLAGMEAKAIGAWNLHTLFNNIQLDFFIALSSTTSMIGNEGQFPYGGANAFLDGLCQMRRNNGLSALSISLGPVSDAGYLTKKSDVQHILTQGGWKSISIQQITLTIEYLLKLGFDAPTNIGLIPMQISIFSQAHPTLFKSGRFNVFRENLISKSTSESPTHSANESSNSENNQVKQIDSSTFLNILFEKTKSQRSTHIREEILQIIASSMHISIERIDPDSPLTDIGLDSLMAMELRRKLSDKLSVIIPAGQLLQQIPLINLINNWIIQVENKFSQLQQSKSDIVISYPITISSNTKTNVDEYTNKNMSSFNNDMKAKDLQPIFLIFAGENEKTVQLQIESAISQLQKSEFDWTVYSKLAIHQINYVRTLPTEKCIYRAYVIAHVTQILNELQKILQSSTSITHVKPINAKETNPFQICYLFSGQGSQYVGMAKELNSIPFFHSYIQGILESIPDNELRLNINELLFSNEILNDNQMEILSNRLQNTIYSQTTLFALELTLNALWKRYGIHPNLLLGHSLGELSAASSSFAGIFSLRGSESISSIHEASLAMRFVLERAKLMSTQMIGNMMAISIGRIQAEQFLIENKLNNDLYILLDNAIDSCVIGGNINSVKKLESLLKEKEIHYSILHTNHAFHSPMMEPAANEFRKILDNFIYENESMYLPVIPNVPILSNVTGTWIRPDQLSDPDYFATHITSPVRFTQCIELALDWVNNNSDKKSIFLEIGPGDALSKLLLRTTRLKFQNSPQFITVFSLPSASTVIKEQSNTLTTDARIHFLKSLGRLWNIGVNIRLDLVLQDFYTSSTALTKPVNYQFSTSQQRILQNLRNESISNSNRLIDNPAFHISLALHLEDKPIELVNYALKQIVQRYDALRYHLQFNNNNNNNIPVIINSQEASTIIEVSYLEVDDEIISQTLNDLSFEVFDLYSGPLIRAVILKTKKSSQRILQITLHHLVADGVSVDILLNDLKTIFAGKILPEISESQQFSNLIITQNFSIETMKTSNFLLTKNYNEITSIPAFIYCDRALTWIKNSHENAPIHLKSTATIVEIPFNACSLTKLKGISKTMEITPAALTIASLVLTLSRFASCGVKEVDTIMLGLQYSNRMWNNQSTSDFLAAKNCVGSFVNTLIIQTQLQKFLDESFSSLAYDVWLSISSAIEDGILINPFEQQQLSSLKKSSVQTVCNYHSYSESSDDNMIITREPWTVFDIEFHLFEEGDELSGWVRYRKSLFSIDLINALVNSYASVLSQIIEMPNINLKNIRTFSPSYVPQIISLWENTRKMILSEPEPFVPVNTNVEKSYLVHQRFEMIAKSEEFTNRIAIKEVYDMDSLLARTLSYCELLEMARTISTYLNINPGEPVGVYMERNAKAVASYLGIMMAGGAYMPLDIKIFPYERLLYVCNNSRIRHLITLKTYVEQIQEIVSMNSHIIVLFVDELLENMNNNNNLLYSTSSNNHILNCHNPAYVCYTSGSTGQPKGVPVTHMNVTSLLDCSYEDWKFNSNASIVWFHSPSFDLSGWEMWGALLYGGLLTIVPNDILNSSADLWNFIQQFQITHLSQTPAAFYEFCHYDYSQKDELQTLIMVMLCGDSLIFSQSDLKNFIQRYENKRHSINVINSYGITESTIVNSYRRVTIQDVTTNIPSTSRIGTALRNGQFLILDDKLQPVPPGVPGEMFIAGPCISRGYLFNEEATKHRFSLDNNLILPAFRQYALFQDNLLNLYQTGDIVRFDAASGDFEFLGRMTHNIKYNGHRIDIIEIEGAINKLPEVKSSVVALVELHNRSLLVAYVQFNDSIITSKLNTKLIRQQLVRILPDVLIPTRIIPVKYFPLNGNKKVDRKFLSTFEGMKKIELNSNDETDLTGTYPITAKILQDMMESTNDLNSRLDVLENIGNQLMTWCQNTASRYMGYQRRMRITRKDENNKESYDDCAEAADKFVSRLLPLALMNYGSINDENEYNSALTCSSMETMLLSTIAKLFNAANQPYGGYVTSGGTESNLYSIWTIRELARQQNCSLIVIASDYAHYSIGKTCNILQVPLYSIPSNGNGEMNYNALNEILIRIQKDQSENTFICVIANIGTTFGGAVDNVDHIRNIFENVKIDSLKSFIHADAAHAGIINAFYPAHNTKLILGKNIDSICISGQKFFGCCFPCSIILHDLSRLPYPNGKLVPYAANRPDVTTSGTRNGTAIAWLWSYISLKTIDGLKKEVELSLRRADQLVTSLQSVNISYFRNSYSTAVIFPCPSKDLQEKYYLMALPDVHLAQCTAMPHITEQTISTFVNELISDLKASNFNFTNQQSKF